MLPHLGAGAGQGVEDVYVLTRLLSHSLKTKADLQVGASYTHLIEVRHSNLRYIEHIYCL